MHDDRPMREWIIKLEERTTTFAERAKALCDLLPNTPGIRPTAYQLSEASGSVASNHSACRRSRSDRELAAKLQVVNEEADECVKWLELLSRAPTGHAGEVAELLAEAKELRAIFGKSVGTTNRRIDAAEELRKRERERRRKRRGGR